MIEFIDEFIGLVKPMLIKRIVSKGISTFFPAEKQFDIGQQYIIDPDESSSLLQVELVDFRTKDIICLDNGPDLSKLVYKLEDLKLEELINIYKIITD